MGYIKAILVSAAVALAVIFMIQNIEPLSNPLSLRLNLYFLNLESTPYPTYLVIMLAFFFGLLGASMVGLLERMRLRKEIRARKKDIDKLNNEINSLRNLPLTDEKLAAKANGHEPEPRDDASAEQGAKAE